MILEPDHGPVEVSEGVIGLQVQGPADMEEGLIQVAQETSMKDMTTRFQAMSERLMADPDIRRSAEQMQERLMADPETRQLLEELMRRLGTPPGETQN